MPDRGTGDSKPAISRPPLSGRASEPARAEDPTVPGPLLRVNWGNLKFSQPFALLLRSCVIAHTFILALAGTPSGQAAPHSVAAHSAGMPSAQARNFPPSPVPLRVLLRIRPAAPISSRHASVPRACAPVLCPGPHPRSRPWRWPPHVTQALSHRRPNSLSWAKARVQSRHSAGRRRATRPVTSRRAPLRCFLRKRDFDFVPPLVLPFFLSANLALSIKTCCCLSSVGKLVTSRTPYVAGKRAKMPRKARLGPGIDIAIVSSCGHPQAVFRIP